MSVTDIVSYLEEHTSNIAQNTNKHNVLKLYHQVVIGCIVIDMSADLIHHGYTFFSFNNDKIVGICKVFLFL